MYQNENLHSSLRTLITSKNHQLTDSKTTTYENINSYKTGFLLQKDATPMASRCHNN